MYDPYYFIKRMYNDISRTDIINTLIDKYGYKSYLEIGVAGGENFENIHVANKIGVDPNTNSKATIFMTSDEFFNSISEDDKYDIIFIDGLHEYETCYRDIVNSAKHLNKGGTIVCHDMNPVCKEFITPGYDVWNGDVYKSFIRFRMEHREFSCCLIYDVDQGLGIIREGIGEKISCDLNTLTYGDWNNNKQHLMNCISYDDFAKLFL